MAEKATVGIIAAPELAEEIAYKLMETLPAALQEHVSNQVEWKIEYAVDPLTGAAETVDEIFQEAATFTSDKRWDYIVCLTDLPLFHSGKVVAVDSNEDVQISIISIPAFGMSPLIKRIEKSIVYTCQTMQKNDSTQTKEHKNDGSSMKLLKRSFPTSPVRKVRLKMNETGDVHTRVLVVPRLYGLFYLLLGMTTANNPFRMMSSLTNVVAIAFTTGAFGMIFTTMWKLSHLFSNWRLTGVMLAAILGMVIWITIAQELWEPRTSRSDKRIRNVYNATTAMTLFAAISAYYIVVFVLFSITSFIFIPPSFLAETLGLDTAPTIVHYLKIAWFASSLSIVAGAIGAGLANEELVRNSTYGYRQRKRYNEIERQNI